MRLYAAQSFVILPNFRLNPPMRRFLVRAGLELCGRDANAEDSKLKFFHEAVDVLEGVKRPPADCLTAARFFTLS